MAAPSYNTDLVNITTAESGTWAELATTYTAGGTVTVPETDYYIQGTGCASQALSASKSGFLFSLVFNYGSSLTSVITAGKCVFMWQVLQAGNAMETFDNNGLNMFIGDSLTAAGGSGGKIWRTGGKNFGRNPYGGWQNVAVDPRVNADTAYGTPTGAYQFFGSVLNTTAVISKGSPHAVDAIRYGRGTILITGGTVATGGTFAGIAARNDNQTYRWGLFQTEGTGYLWKGLLSFGDATHACVFIDANRNITIDNTPRTYAAFNKIEIYNTGSTVTWSTINFTALLSTQLSRGNFEMMSNATTSFSNCIFTDMYTFIFKSTATLTSCIFRRCDQITQGSATFTNCLITYSTAAKNMVVDDISKITYTDFVSDGTGYAIEGFSSADDYQLVGLTFTGYAVSGGTSGNEAIHVLATGGTVNLYISGEGSADPSIHTAGATVNIISNSVDVGITVKTSDGDLINGARVLLLADEGGTLPYRVSVTIANTGTTATVTHTAHQMATNDKVEILGASHQANNGVFTTTKINDNCYSYTMASTPGSNPTGTIRATYVAISDTTDETGYLTMSRVFLTDQPVYGWARKSSSSPLYKTGNIVDTIDKDTGLQISVLLIPDE